MDDVADPAIKRALPSTLYGWRRPPDHRGDMDTVNIGFVGGLGIELAMIMRDAKAGNGRAACRLGDLYREGKKLPFKPKEAFRWYARSALAGDAAGQNNLGACYEHGLGCRPNHRQSAKWYRLSASQGLPTAQFNLGLACLKGRGVPQSVEVARVWLQLAANQREPGAAEAVRHISRTHVQ